MLQEINVKETNGNRLEKFTNREPDLDGHDSQAIGAAVRRAGCSGR